MIPISFLLCSLEKEEDRDKLSAIYEKYLPLMTFVACRYVGRYNAEEDVVHDAIITIINNLDDIDLDNEEKLGGMYTRRSEVVQLIGCVTKGTA